MCIGVDFGGSPGTLPQYLRRESPVHLSLFTTFCPTNIWANPSIFLTSLRQWKCGGLVVKYRTCDSSTCVTIQEQLGSALLWNACRHHVGEVIYHMSLNDMKIETSKSPEVTVFARFSKHFQLLCSHRSASLHSCREGS